MKVEIQQNLCFTNEALLLSRCKGSFSSRPSFCLPCSCLCRLNKHLRQSERCDWGVWIGRSCLYESGRRASQTGGTSKQNTLGLPRYTTLTLQLYRVPTVQCCSRLGSGHHGWLMSTVQIIFGLVPGENRKEGYLVWLYVEEKVQNRRYYKIFVNSAC